MLLRYFFSPDRAVVAEVKELGDKTGYDCAGPLSSLLLGRAGIPTLFRVFNKGEACVSDTEKVEKIIAQRQHIKDELTDLFAEAGIGGACRFWREHDKETFAKNDECKTIQDKIRQAERACFKR